MPPTPLYLRTATVGFKRGTPARQAVFAPLAKTHDENNLRLFGGSASNVFVKLNANFSQPVHIGTTAVVTTQAKVSPEDAYVYYIEFNGYLHQASTEDLMDTWVFDLGVPVEAESALRKDGSVMYVADVSGLIRALRLGDLPTEAPSSGPSHSPSVVSSSAPTTHPTGATPAPSSVPTVQTDSPTTAPTEAQVTSAPTLSPTVMKIPDVGGDEPTGADGPTTNADDSPEDSVDVGDGTKIAPTSSGCNQNLKFMAAALPIIAVLFI